jgi:hypothetical protein
MAESMRISTSTARRPHLYLATEEGELLSPPRVEVAPIDAPEVPLEIEFEGLTLEEQRAAIAAFPGGRRFVLVVDNRA